MTGVLFKQTFRCSSKSKSTVRGLAVQFGQKAKSFLELLLSHLSKAKCIADTREANATAEAKAKLNYEQFVLVSHTYLSRHVFLDIDIHQC